MPRKRFWTEVAHPRNAIDLHAGAWASDLAEVVPGLSHAGTPMFYQDNRPRQAARALGANDRLDGMSILELGPLEGAHSYQLERLGAARIVAIESNADAFQRCLVVKNLLGLDRTTFLLGDCVGYLETTSEHFDMIFASGILYHLQDPVGLIRLLAARTRKLFVWTQYYDARFRYANGKALPHRARHYERDGFAAPLYELVYRGRFGAAFLGGNRRTTNWMALADIRAALRHYGFDAQDLIEDVRGERGPAATLAAYRT